MADHKEVARIVAELSAAYPNFSPTDYTTEIYFQDLQDVDAELLYTAAKHCRTSTQRDQRFAPSAGEIRQAVSEIKRQIQGIPSAVEAWAELLHAPISEKTSWASDPPEYTNDGRAVIYEKPYQWSHPLVRKVAVMMGFPRFPDWEAESFERTAFLKAYEIELQNFLKQENQLPEVVHYIEEQRGGSALISETLKQLKGKIK